MRWLRLTEADTGQAVHINMARVADMRRFETYTRLRVESSDNNGGGIAYAVAETPEDILRMLERPGPD